MGKPSQEFLHKKQKRIRMCFSIYPEIVKRMRKRRDINWSAVVSDACDKMLSQIEK